jgi:uncharacterized RDD family membrane protein YckC
MRTTLTESAKSETFAAAHRSVKSTSHEPDQDSLSASTLIEFPSGRNVPEWRKRLSLRVREIQEQKAREAAEADAATRAAETVSCALPSGQLELVPEPEQAPLNPIVSKALERVERARRGEHPSTMPTATAAAPALAAVPKATKEVLLPPEATPESVDAAAIETKPKLSIVAPLAVPEPGLQPPAATEVIQENKESPNVEQVTERPKRVRVISESVIALMVSPVAFGIQATSRNWSNPRVIGLVAGVAATAMLVYFTISIALTGRTLAMRLLSVKAIDARTGLIPTGGQSIKRALGYLFSLAILGLGFAFALIDRDHRTLHDRFSRTIVVHN